MKHNLLFIGGWLLGLNLVTFAQTFSLDWQRISIGGGQSAGGAFSLDSSINYLQGSTAEGGNFSLDSTLLHGVVVIPSTNSPALSVQLINAEFLITWPLEGSTGFQLQETITLGNSASWQPALGTLETNGEIKILSVQPLGLKFYRLTKP